MKDLKNIACNLCAKRDGCMPCSDSDLIVGANDGHVPLIGECGYYVEGSEDLKSIALSNLDDFNQYAKNLIASFNKK